MVNRGKNLNHERSNHIIKNIDVSHQSDIIMCKFKTHTTENFHPENPHLDEFSIQTTPNRTIPICICYFNWFDTILCWNFALFFVNFFFIKNFVYLTNLYFLHISFFFLAKHFFFTYIFFSLHNFFYFTNFVFRFNFSMFSSHKLMSSVPQLISLSHKLDFLTFIFTLFISRIKNCILFLKTLFFFFKKKYSFLRWYFFFFSRIYNVYSYIL